MFEIDLAGFKQLMADRPKWHFVRELISNSLDEASVDNIDIELDKTPRYCTITVTDDGDGFENLSDAWTLFAETKKRHDAEVRGRFNLGEKELASIAREMIIETTTGTVEFKDGKRIRRRRQRENGTLVRATIPMSHQDYDLTLAMVRLFILPVAQNVTLNGDKLCHREDPYRSVVETLPTVLVNSETNRMGRTQRKTQVDVYPRRKGDSTAWLYELGIPVQPIACDYDVDVNQKIPLNANRDTVLDSYLEKIYAVVLNQVYEDLNAETVSGEWVRLGQQSNLATDEALSDVRVKRYGEKSVLWSSDAKANERAQEAGYNVVGRNELSQHEKGRFHSVGLLRASEKFKTSLKPAEPEIPEEEWTDNMKEFARIHRSLSKFLTGKDIGIAFDYDSEVSAAAETDGINVTYHIPNMAHIGSGEESWDIKPRDEDNLAILVHELAHDQRHRDRSGFPHGEVFWRRLQDFAGKLLVHSLDDFV